MDNSDDSRGRSMSRRRSPWSRSASRICSRSCDSHRYSKFDNETGISNFHDLLKQQEEHLCDLMLDHKQEVVSLVKEKTKNFRKKPLQKQFEFLDELYQILDKAKKYLKKEKVDEALTLVHRCSERLKDKKEDLLVADQSPHGWLAVSLLQEGSDLPRGTQRKLDKINSRLDKVRGDRKSGHYGRHNKGNFEPLYKQDGVHFSRQPQRKSPQEMLNLLGNQKKSGLCSHCQEAGHFYRECPKFWEAVNESRKKN